MEMIFIIILTILLVGLAACVHFIDKYVEKCLQRLDDLTEALADLDQQFHDHVTVYQGFALGTATAISDIEDAAKGETDDRLHDCMELSKRIAHFENKEAKLRMLHNEMCKPIEGKHAAVSEGSKEEHDA